MVEKLRCYPIIRTNKSNLNLSLCRQSFVSHKNSIHKGKDSTINSFKTELSGNFFDKIGNGGEFCQPFHFNGILMVLESFPHWRNTVFITMALQGNNP